MDLIGGMGMSQYVVKIYLVNDSLRNKLEDINMWIHMPLSAPLLRYPKPLKIATFNIHRVK